MGSKSFSAQGPNIPHLSKGELLDLRQDVEAGFETCEALVDAGHIPTACLSMATKPGVGDTVSIGADVYEFGGTGSNINVAIGAAVTNSRTNLAAAINASGTASVRADVVTSPAAGVAIKLADEPGGTAVPGVSPSLVLATALTAPADVWNQANLTATGAAEGTTYRASGKVVVDAVNLVGSFLIALPFTPTSVMWAAFNTTGAPKATTATVVVTTGGLLVTADAGATGLVATDFIVWAARE